MRKKFDTVIANEKINSAKLAQAQEIILKLYRELPGRIAKGYGPFMAAVYDKNGKLIAKTVNTVMHNKCSNNHAEMNAIRMAEKVLKTHDLSSHDVSLYVTAEPCMMCLGGIMWSGIKNVYFGVPSNMVEKITGFDEGFKPNWLEEFKKRGICVYGNIETDIGAKVLEQYIQQKRVVYNPKNTLSKRFLRLFIKRKS